MKVTQKIGTAVTASGELVDLYVGVSKANMPGSSKFSRKYRKIGIIAVKSGERAPTCLGTHAARVSACEIVADRVYTGDLGGRSEGAVAYRTAVAKARALCG